MENAKIFVVKRWPQLIAASLLITVALSRAVWPPLASRTDNTFLVLLGAAITLALVPLDKVKSFKAGGFEILLESPQVQGALSSLKIESVQSVRLRARLDMLGDLLPVIRNARVIWVDDRQENILAERRLLRALGITVVTANSTEQALEIMQADNDFDLIISDVQRSGDTYKVTAGVKIHEGVNFVQWLRTSHPDQGIRQLPAIFYAAYDWPRLVKFTEPARRTLPEPEISNSVADFIPKVIIRLAESRIKPIQTPDSKEPTSVEQNNDDVLGPI